MTAHAKYPPSAAHRWVKCSAAVGLTLDAPRRSSPEAAEGTVAHDLAARTARGECDPHDLVGTVLVEDGHSVEVTAEMAECVKSYADYVRSFLKPGGSLQIEERATLPGKEGLCWGTADARAIVLQESGARTAHIIEFKYGKGVRVSAHDNDQMLLYAQDFGSALAVGVDTVTLHVVQPRIAPGLSTHTMAATVVKSHRARFVAAIEESERLLAAKTPREMLFAYATAGEHCRFCPARAECPALATFAVRSAQNVFGSPSSVPVKILAEVLAEAEVIDVWIAAVREEALARAKDGVEIAGFKLAQKRAMRQWLDESALVKKAQQHGHDPYGPQPVLSPAQLEKKIGKGTFGMVYAGLAESRSSGVVLVANSDPRPSVTPEDARAIEARAAFKRSAT